LVATAICFGDFALDDAVAQAFVTRRTGRYQVNWDGSSEPLSLDVLARQGLSVLRQAAFGPGAASGGASVTPFTVATVVRADGLSGADVRTRPPDDGLIHRTLHALTSWSPTYQFDAVPPLEQASLELRKWTPAGHVLYGDTRGRAVWFPGHCLQADGMLHTLSCYHSNLVWTSLQVESLGGLISQTAKQIGAGAVPASGSFHHACAHRAAASLSLLYGGGGATKETYRSWSARRQIVETGLVAPLNVVRDRVCSWGPLS
jgi:hypothetical protein